MTRGYSHRFRSDAEPGALADYILALLKHDKPEDELRLFCSSQLGDFIRDGTLFFSW